MDRVRTETPGGECVPPVEGSGAGIWISNKCANDGFDVLTRVWRNVGYEARAAFDLQDRHFLGECVQIV